MTEQTYSKGVALVLATIFGPFGADKLYIGKTGLFVAQLIASITIIGLLWSGPYAFISMLTLTLTILFGVNTFLYPVVNWEPTTSTDKAVAWIIVALVFIIPTIVAIIGRGSSEKFQHIENKNRYKI